MNDINEFIKEIRKRLEIEVGFEFKFDPSIPTAAIDMSNFKLSFNPKFLERFSDDGKKGVIAHELGHYKYWPFDLETLVLELFKVSKIQPDLDANEVRYIVNWFNDLIDNIRTSIEIPEIATTYKELGASSSWERILNTYYSEITGKDFGKYDLTVEENEIKLSLYYINPFENRYNLINSELPKFVKIYLKAKQNFNIPIPNNSEKYIFSNNDVKDVIRKLIREGKIDKEDVKNISKLFPEIANNPVEANKFYYRNVSLRYDIKVEPLPLASNGGSYPITHKKWSSSDPITTYDPYTSFGKIIPGISNKWEYKSFTTYGKRKELPPAIIVLDSSGSMPNPIEVESPAVIAAYVIARRYITHGSEVAVINFSSDTLQWKFSKSLSEIENGLIKYQGGSTFLDVKILKELDKERGGKADLYMITDVGLNDINNLIETLEYLNSREGRSIIFLIKGDNPPNLDELKEKYKRIKFYDVSNPSELPKIVIKTW